MNFTTVAWQDGAVRLLDQVRLPAEEVYLDCRTIPELVVAIRALSVRGAPAIGVAAAHGLTLAADLALAEGRDLLPALEEAAVELKAARPTAVNLAWAVDRVMKVARSADGVGLRDAVAAEAAAIETEDRELCRRMGENGAALLPENATVLTHCNTGALATAGIGTALGVIYVAHEQGKLKKVFSDETRPLLQGGRLTAWELQRNGIDVSLLVDGAAGWCLKTQGVDAVIVGSDRIAANGDVANKIGTYPLAVLARRHGVPFYVVAPYSTLDLSVASGEEIPIEMRDAAEVHGAGGHRWAPEGVGGFNPAFDVTPAELVTAIVTEAGVFRPPYRDAFEAAYAAADGPTA